MIEDETMLFQYGQTEIIEYYTDQVDGPEELSFGDTSWNQFPNAQNPFDRYKFISLQFTFGKDQYVTTRTAYGVLDWLSDCGGLVDILFLIAEVFISPFAAYTLKSKLSTSLVRYKRSESPDKARAFQEQRRSSLTGPQSYADADF